MSAALDLSVDRFSMTRRDLLALAWLCQQAARGCDAEGRTDWAGQLRADASRLRAWAVDR